MDGSLIILFIGGLVLTGGDLVMKIWVGNNKISFYIIGLITYLIGLVLLSQSFKFKNIAMASLLLVIFNILTLSFVSWVFYKESLSTYKIVGVILGFVAVGLLEI